MRAGRVVEGCCDEGAGVWNKSVVGRRQGMRVNAEAGRNNAGQ